MIRFNCPNCARYYELSPALAFLPLVCKQCGHRITPPAADPEPPPAPKPAPPKPAPPVTKAVAPPPAKAPPKPVEQPVAKKPPVDEDEDDGVLVTKADSTPDIDFNVGGPTAASLSDATRARPAGLSDATRTRPMELDDATEPEINLGLLGPEPTRPIPKRAARPPEPEAPPEARPEPTVLPFVADLIVFVVLVVVGMLLGELLVKKPTGQVLGEAGSATKFPPIDLLLWAAPPVLFALVYLLLGSRERTVGAWLRRRRVGN